MSRTFTPSGRIPSSMQRFDNLRKPHSKGLMMRIALQDKKIKEHNDVVIETLRERREKMFNREHDITGMTFLRAKRIKNINGQMAFNLTGFGNIIGTFEDVKQSARLIGRDYVKMGAITVKA